MNITLVNNVAVSLSIENVRRGSSINANISFGNTIKKVTFDSGCSITLDDGCEEFSIRLLKTLLESTSVNFIDKSYDLNNKDDFDILSDLWNDKANNLIFIQHINNGIDIYLDLKNRFGDNSLNSVNAIMFDNRTKVQVFIETHQSKLAKDLEKLNNDSYLNYNDRFNLKYKINQYINYIKTDVKYHTSVNAIPECLQGKYPLTGIAQFLEVTTRMVHSGFVLSNNVMYYGNTRKLNNRNIGNIVYSVESQLRNRSEPLFVPVFNSDLYLPFNHANNAEKEININNYEDKGFMSDSEMSYNDKVGYYNNETHCIVDDELYDIDDCVMLHDGTMVVNDDDVAWVERENEYYLTSDCRYTHEGEWELSNECVYLDGNWYHNVDDNVYSCEDCGEYCLNSCICEDCSENARGDLSRFPYHTDVINKCGFGVTNHYINKQPVYVGLEFECLVNGNSDDVETINSLPRKYCIPTEDGSLDDNYGVEFVFRPEGLEQQKVNVDHFIRYCGDSLNNDYNSDYGLHVHVSSHFLGTASKLKIQNFVTKNHDMMELIGGREATEYQERKTCKFKDLSTNRYGFVNINPDKTIEFRFPASYVNADHVNMNLENALALTMFCKFHLKLNALRKDHKLSFVQYCDYVIENKVTYPLLSVKLTKLKQRCLDRNSIHFTNLGYIQPAVAEVA